MGRSVSHIVRRACGRADSVMAIFGKYNLPTQPHNTHSIPKQFVQLRGNSIPLAVYLYRTDRPNPFGAMRFKRALSRVSGKEKQVSSWGVNKEMHALYVSPRITMVSRIMGVKK